MVRLLNVVRMTGPNAFFKYKDDRNFPESEACNKAHCTSMAPSTVYLAVHEMTVEHTITPIVGSITFLWIVILIACYGIQKEDFL